MASIPRSKRDVRIVLAAGALLSFTSASRAAALALPELAFAAFFIGGVLRDTAGPAAPWVILLATVLGLAVRRLDLASWTLVMQCPSKGHKMKREFCRMIYLVLIRNLDLEAQAAPRTRVAGQKDEMTTFRLARRPARRRRHPEEST